MNLGYLHKRRLEYEKAIDYWQQAQAKIHPDSPEAKQLAQTLQNPYGVSKKQILMGCLPQVAILAFAIFNLFRGHWMLALLVIAAWGSFLVYRLYRFWQVRRSR